MSNQLTLNKVAAKFSKWRKTRIHKSTKFPDELLTLIPPLLGKHKISHIAKKLGLSGTKINQIFKRPAVNFIELPCFPELKVNKQEANKIVCEFSRTDGTTLKISVMDTALPSLVREFLCCN